MVSYVCEHIFCVCHKVLLFVFWPILTINKSLLYVNGCLVYVLLLQIFPELAVCGRVCQLGTGS